MAPVLSVLDSIRPDAAERAREYLRDPDTYFFGYDRVRRTLFSEVLLCHMCWLDGVMGYWVEVDNEFEEYVTTWFGKDTRLNDLLEK